MDYKNKLLSLINDLKDAVEQDDITTIISVLSELGIDSRRRTPLGEFVCGLMIEDIKKAVLNEKDGIIKVGRKDVYHEVTYDYYKIKDGILLRNGHDTEWSSVGKLYQAYKKIHKIKENDYDYGM